VVSAKMTGNIIYVVMEWRKRPNGFKPRETIVTNDVVKEKCPKLLIEYYESRINPKLS